MRPLLTALLTLGLLGTTAAQADIQQCDGKWTNLPCNGAAGKTATKTPTTVMSPGNAKEISQKKSIFHELTMLALKAKREHEIRFDLEDVRSYCFDEAHSLDECRDKIDDSTDRIQTQLDRAEARAEKELALKREKEEKEEAAKNAKTPAQTFINIIPRRIYNRRRGYPYRYPVSRDPQNNYDTQVSEQNAGGSVSVTASGNNVTFGSSLHGGIRERRVETNSNGWIVGRGHP